MGTLIKKIGRHSLANRFPETSTPPRICPATAPPAKAIV